MRVHRSYLELLKKACFCFVVDRVPVSHSWTVSTLFQPASKFTLVGGTELKLNQNAVPRITDFNGDGIQDLLVASEGRVWAYTQSERYFVVMRIKIGPLYPEFVDLC